MDRSVDWWSPRRPRTSSSPRSRSSTRRSWKRGRTQARYPGRSTCTRRPRHPRSLPWTQATATPAMRRRCTDSCRGYTRWYMPLQFRRGATPRPAGRSSMATPCAWASASRSLSRTTSRCLAHGARYQHREPAAARATHTRRHTTRGPAVGASDCRPSVSGLLERNVDCVALLSMNVAGARWTCGASQVSRMAVAS